MIDEKRIERFIEGAKEAFKKVDDPTFTFPMNILSAYELATSIEELLKAQDVTDTNRGVDQRKGQTAGTPEGGMNVDDLREKVMKGLELCDIGSGDKCYETGCPYYQAGCTEQLKEDALELLKAREPRVMTQEEAISDYTGVVYYESIYSSIVLAGYMVSIRDGRCEFATIGSEETEKEMLSDYGIKWRCWTSRPTDEQRKAVKWE